MYLKKFASYANSQDNSQLFCFRTQCIQNKTFENVLRHGIRLNISSDNHAFRLTNQLIGGSLVQILPVVLIHCFYVNFSLAKIRKLMTPQFLAIVQLSQQYTLFIDFPLQLLFLILSLEELSLTGSFSRSAQKMMILDVHFASLLFIAFFPQLFHHEYQYACVHLPQFNK